MKVFVSIDLEGCTGVRDLSQTRSSGAGYAAALALQRSDLEAVLEGCRASGATEFVVCDAHARGANVGLDGLGDDVRLVAGMAGPLGMMSGVDPGVEAALFVGYHAMAGTRAAVLDHTFAQTVFRVRVDDADEAGELGLNAAVAGAFGVPLVFASGDDKLAAEASRTVPGIGTAVVKEGIARCGARLVSPALTAPRLRADGSSGARGRRVAAATRLGRASTAPRLHAQRLRRRGGDLPRSRTSRRAHGAHRRAALPRCLPHDAGLHPSCRSGHALRSEGRGTLLREPRLRGVIGARFVERM